MRASLPSLVLVLAALAGCAEKLPEAHVLPLVEAERAFSHVSADRGVKAAFLEHLAAESIVFRPGPVPGPAFFRERPDAGGVLTWDPSYAEMSSGRELGYTCGPYTYREPSGDVRYGHYVSVWRKQKDGKWRVVADGGNRHAPPLQVAEHFEYLPARAGEGTPAKIDTTAEWVRLQAAERALVAAWTRPGGSQALIQFAAADIRYFPPDALPVSGRGAVQTALLGRQETLGFTPTGGAIAPTGDLAYTFGDATRKLAAEAPVESGGYLRIWRRSRDGVWQVALELASMPPRAAPAPKDSPETTPAP